MVAPTWLLMSSPMIGRPVLGDVLVLGELSLDGGVQHVNGVLPMATLARESGELVHDDGLGRAGVMGKRGPHPAEEALVPAVGQVEQGGGLVQEADVHVAAGPDLFGPPAASRVMPGAPRR